MKIKKGATLIELLVVMVLIGIMVVSFTQIYVNGMKTYREQFSQTRLESDTQTIVDRVVSDIKLSKSVEASYLTYNTSVTTLILAVPAIDSSQNFIYSGDSLVLDRIIYYQDNNNLHRVIYADIGSSRYSQNAQDLIISKKVSNLVFSYDPDINAPAKVSAQLTLSEKVGSETRQAVLTGKASLRNNL